MQRAPLGSLGPLALFLCLALALPAGCGRVMSGTDGDDPDAPGGPTDELPVELADDANERNTSDEAPTLAGDGVQLIREQEIGRPGGFYMDPEFDAGTWQVAFYFGSKPRDCDQVYLGRIDPASGRFVDHDYLHVDRAAPIVATFNGPEFGHSRRGLGLYYTGVDANRRYHIFRYRDGQTTQLDAGNAFIVANYASNTPDDEASLVFGARYAPTLILGEHKPWVIYPEDRPDLQRTFHSASIGKGPRFVPGKRQVTTNVADAQGRHQVARYDFDLDTTTQLTFDADDKEGPVMFAAPEYGGELLLLASVDQGRAIRVYRQVQGLWQRQAQFDAPAGATYQNAQALSYRGRTFFTVSTKVEGGDSSDIVLLSLDGALELVVSGEGPMRRFDPETLVSPDGEHLFIYYYDLRSGRLFLSDLVLPAA